MIEAAPRHKFAGRDHDNPLFKKAVDALDNLSVAMAGMAYAAATANRFYQDWITTYGLTPSTKSEECVRRLLPGKRCTRYNPKGRCAPHHPPGNDHATLWLLRGKPIVYVYQPYGVQADLLHKFCAEWGLMYRISTSPGWHYPSSVLHIEITTPEGRELLREERKKRGS